MVIGYTKPVSAPDPDPVWQTVLYGVDGRGSPTWSLGIGGPGRESGRWIARDAESVWATGQWFEDGRGRIWVARLEARR